MDYLNWGQKVIDSPENITEIDKSYNDGYLFTRLKKGLLQKTRSLRIDLDKFSLSSENKRILKKVEEVTLKSADIPFLDYTWHIGKIAKDFYQAKFGSGIFSANKIKELLTNQNCSNFNRLLIFQKNILPIGYVVCFESRGIFHYSYPFYDLKNSNHDLGLGMIIKSIIFAKENKIKYFYLGSLQRQNDTYKLQFKGLEWFDGSKWTEDLESAKKILNS